MSFPARFFVSGTDTDVGKTLVSAILALGLGYEYFKPIQSGMVDGSDTAWVKDHTGLPDDFFHREAYRLNPALSPHEAARLDGVEIDLDSIALPETKGDRGLIVEGAGGVMVPIGPRHMMTDLMKRLDLPVLLVARSGLGTINHTLLSVEQLRREGIPLLGVVMNGPKNPANREAIKYYGDIPVLAQVEPLAGTDAANLARSFSKYFEGNEKVHP